MGGEKSEIRSRDGKSLQKTFLGYQDKSRSSKKPICKKEPEEIDSLIFLKDAKDKKKVKGLDERIKHLKDELKELFGDTKSEKTDSKCFTGGESDLVSPDLALEKHDQITPLNLQSSVKSVGKFDLRAKQSELNLKTSLSKFSEWLDKTVDEVTVDNQNQEFSQCNNMPLCSKPKETPDKLSESFFKSKCFNPPPFPQYKVERLLYQSLYLQNFDIYLSSSDENSIDEVKCTKKRKQQKQKTRKSIKKCSREKHYQSKVNKNCRSSSRPRKRKKMASNSFLDRNVETVDLLDNSSSSCNNNSTVRSSNVECVDLDVTDYDWNEPFDITEKTGFSSDVYIIEDSGEENTDVVSEKLKISNLEPKENLSNIFNDESKNVQLSKGWECPICLELSKGQEVVATQCGHIFCKKCLESHISKSNSNCPTCRNDLNNKPFITLFNF